MLPNPILSFSLFGHQFSIYLYGIMIAVGILVCLAVFYFYTKKKKMPEKVQDFIFICAIIAIALGFLIAKLYQAIYNWIDTGIFDFYRAGITAMGGFIGGAAVFILCYFIGGLFIFQGKDKNLHIREFSKILNCAPCCITIAHAFGRIGCLMAGCCHGKYYGNDQVFGTVWMKGTTKGWGYYIPTQLHEAIFLFALFGLLTYLYFNRSNINMPIYLTSYAIWRFIIEIFRDDYRGAVILGLAPSQWQSVIFIVVAGIIIAYMLIKRIPFFQKQEEKN